MIEIFLIHSRSLQGIDGKDKDILPFYDFLDDAHVSVHIHMKYDKHYKKNVYLDTLV